MVSLTQELVTQELGFYVLYVWYFFYFLQKLGFVNETFLSGYSHVMGFDSITASILPHTNASQVLHIIRLIMKCVMLLLRGLHHAQIRFPFSECPDKLSWFFSERNVCYT